MVLAAHCPMCIFVNFHSFVPSILVHPSVSVHFCLLFPALAFALLTGVVVAMGIRVLSDVVVLLMLSDTYIHKTQNTHIKNNVNISLINQSYRLLF